MELEISHVNLSTPVPPHLDTFHLALSLLQLSSCFEELKNFTGKKEELQELHTNLQNNSFISSASKQNSHMSEAKAPKGAHHLSTPLPGDKYRKISDTAMLCAP